MKKLFLAGTAFVAAVSPLPAIAQVKDAPAAVIAVDTPSANLQRLYGKDWQAQWVTESLRRLRAWGFNTLGNWSHADLHARGRKDRLPFEHRAFYDHF